MAIQSLDTPSVTAAYDADLEIVIISYKGYLSPQYSELANEWFIGLLEILTPRGTIIDMRDVTRINRHHLNSARINTDKLRNYLDMRRYPTAVVVANQYQAEMSRLSLRLTGVNGNGRIVKSIDDGIRFIDHHVASGAG